MEGTKIYSQDFFECSLAGFLKESYPCAFRESLLIVNFILTKGIGRDKVCPAKRGAGYEIPEEAKALQEKSPPEKLCPRSEISPTSSL